MRVHYDFSGHVVLIAGAGSGLGLAMTRACLNAGATVVASDIATDALAAIDDPRLFTSGLATGGWPGATAYGASKAALIALVKSAAQELRPFGVRINAVSPGIMHTPLFHDSASDDEVRMYERSLGVSQPEEVAPMLMHLISDGSMTVSGNVIERRLIPRAEA